MHGRIVFPPKQAWRMGRKIYWLPSSGWIFIIAKYR
jgi:hypothetical protein